MPQTEKLGFQIDGMHCEACVRRVSAALGKVAGVQVEKVSVGSASVVFDPGVVSPAQIADAVDRAGFAAHPSER